MCRGHDTVSVEWHPVPTSSGAFAACGASDVQIYRFLHMGGGKDTDGSKD